MFLSKKLIIAIISLTGILFAILVIIQFIWIKRSVEVSRRQFENKMEIVRDRIYKSYRTDKDFNVAIVPASLPQDLFKENNQTKQFDIAVLHLLDSVLKSQDIYLPCRVAGRVGKTCYIHNFITTATHNYNLDSSDYKICLCRTSYTPNLDIGFSFPEMNKYLVKDNSWLIIPSFLLILLLIALFIFIITIINKQKSLAELKNDFINNLTHEFNTPLFSIGLTSRLLMGAEEISSSGRLKKYMELITTEKNRLQMQVDKMLQLTAIESGSLLMEKNIVDMHKVIEKNIAGFCAAIEEKNGGISYHPEAREHYVSGDQVHLFNTISSLLDNAYKYSHKNPEIVISTFNTSKDLVISIQDNGIGISDTALQMIFDKFYREKQGDRHDVKGFGLGLSYVKKIVEMHKGSIKVKSKKGEGTVFIINLPYRQK
ncbi:MAG: HAMP domain-containing sensor histidine kinase [Ginsengibacter sp.]